MAERWYHSRGIDLSDALTAAGMKVAMATIAQWRLAPDAVVQCPACGSDGLGIIDRSTRPYAEWYVLSCRTCGLDQTLHIPMGPPVMGGFE